MDRRTFVGAAAALFGGLAHNAAAQPRSPRIGFLGNAHPATGASQLEAFRRDLRELGWIEGQTLTIEYRWAEGHPDRLPALVAELVQAKVDVIVLSGPISIRAA